MPLWVRPGGLTFPETPDTPVIMVGPGTGVAPFRAAIQERVARDQTGERAGPRAGWQLGLTRPSLEATLCSPRKLFVLRLPLAGPGLLLGGGVAAAGEEGVPDALHSLLPGAGEYAGRAGARMQVTSTSNALPPPHRSGRYMCSTGSASSGHWCGTCWTARAPTSIWQGEPGLLGGVGASPKGGPSHTEPIWPVPPATPSACQQMCRKP